MKAVLNDGGEQGIAVHQSTVSVALPEADGETPVTILPDVCELADSIDEDRARASKERAASPRGPVQMIPRPARRGAVRESAAALLRASEAAKYPDLPTGTLVGRCPSGGRSGRVAARSA